MATRHRMKWTNEEDEKLIEGYLTHYNYDKLSKDLKRSIGSIQCRITKKLIYPLIKANFYDKNNILNQKKLEELYFTNILTRYSKFYQIDYDDLEKYIYYCDKNLKAKTINYDENEIIYNRPNTPEPSEESETIGISESDEESESDNTETLYSDTEPTETEYDSDTELSDEDIDYNIYKLKYYKYRYLYEKTKYK